MYIAGATTHERGPITGLAISTRRRWFWSVGEQLVYLRGLIDDWRGSQWVRELAVHIVFEIYKCPPKNFLQHAVAISEYVQNHVTYVNELPETFQTPKRTLSWGYGDCDDFTTAQGSLIEAVGIPVRVVGMKLDDEFVHVFPQAEILMPDGQMIPIPLDCTLDVPVRTLPDPIADMLAQGYRVHTLTV